MKERLSTTIPSQLESGNSKIGNMMSHLGLVSLLYVAYGVAGEAGVGTAALPIHPIGHIQSVNLQGPGGHQLLASRMCKLA